MLTEVDSQSSKTNTGMITPFVVQSDLHLDKSSGAFIGGVFRATFFAGRILCAIFYKISLRITLMASLFELIPVLRHSHRNIPNIQIQ